MKCCLHFLKTNHMSLMSNISQMTIHNKCRQSIKVESIYFMFHQNTQSNSSFLHNTKYLIINKQPLIYIIIYFAQEGYNYNFNRFILIHSHTKLKDHYLYTTFGINFCLYLHYFHKYNNQSIFIREVSN